MKGKYFPHSDIYNILKPKPFHSIIWNNLYKKIKFLREASFWILGNGEHINVWKDKWIDNIIIEYYIEHIPPNLMNLKVRDLINWTNRIWNLSSIESICPNFILRKIIATPIPMSDREDKLQ